MGLAELDKQYVWHPFTQMQGWIDGDPLVIAQAEGSYLIDTDGNRYLDGVSSLWVNVHGHAHPTINAAIKKQLDLVAHTTLLGLASPPSIELAARLATLAPGELRRVFYSDSGSTAVEIALKIAFQYWQHLGKPKKTKFVHLAEAYHGDTLGAVGVGGMDLFHRVFGPLLVDSPRIPTPAHVGKAAALEAAQALLEAKSEQIAALIIEPLVQGAAGMLMQPPGYLAGLATLCKAHDVLLIADEVATGFGRTGVMFACQHEAVKPDLMCLAKGITGGYLPLAATLTTTEIHDAFRGEGRTFYHGHTYTGNPLACAAALASLDLFEQNAVLDNVARRAQQLTNRTKATAQLGAVREVRQRGLMMGIELNREGVASDELLGARVCSAARAHGVILRPLGDVIVVMPPLSISADEVELLVTAIESAIQEICG